MLSGPSKSSLNPKRRPDEMKVKGYFYRPEGLRLKLRQDLGCQLGFLFSSVPTTLRSRERSCHSAPQQSVCPQTPHNWRAGCNPAQHGETQKQKSHPQRRPLGKTFDPAWPRRLSFEVEDARSITRALGFIPEMIFRDFPTACCTTNHIPPRPLPFPIPAGSPPLG